LAAAQREEATSLKSVSYGIKQNNTLTHRLRTDSGIEVIGVSKRLMRGNACTKVKIVTSFRRVGQSPRLSQRKAEKALTGLVKEARGWKIGF
jgi:hypothetical protein